MTVILCDGHPNAYLGYLWVLYQVHPSLFTSPIGPHLIAAQALVISYALFYVLVLRRTEVSFGGSWAIFVMGVLGVTLVPSLSFVCFRLLLTLSRSFTLTLNSQIFLFLLLDPTVRSTFWLRLCFANAFLMAPLCTHSLISSLPSSYLF